MIFADRPHPAVRGLDALRRHEPVVRAQGARGAARRPRGARERQAGATQVLYSVMWLDYSTTGWEFQSNIRFC